jgi:hypothetical protein
LAEVAGVSTAEDDAGVSTADEMIGVSTAEEAGVSTAEETALEAGAVDDSITIVEDITSLEVEGTSGSEGGVYGVSALQSKPMLWKPISQDSFSPL